PASHRRRMSALAKMAVQVALEATSDAGADYLVFCSQHGELPRTRELLATIVNGGELSPMSFSQSVHNTSAGLYTIIKGIQVPTTSLAAGAGTFAYGWIEAETYLRSYPGRRALLVSYDEVLPSEYRVYSRQEQRSYALALLLAAAGSGGIAVELTSAEVEERLPMAPLFAAWALSQEPELTMTAGGQGFAWRRLGT
ncbi:MAG TPA: beta-ketoacyl synthase chain length factor, partial [Gammaproteobacteria bacterium]